MSSASAAHPAAPRFCRWGLVCWLALVCRLALVCTLALGCDLVGGNGPVNACSNDRQCPDEGYCSDAGLCVANVDDPLNIIVQVVPEVGPYGGTPVNYAFEPILVTEALEQDFRLPLPSQVKGSVSSSLQPVLAEVSFVPVPRFPGEPLSVRTVQTRHAETENLSTQLAAGRAYQVSVEPTGRWRTQVPPLHLTDPSEQIVAEPVVNLLLEYGELTRIAGLVRDASGQGQNELLVRAVNPATGRVVSTTYTTEANAEAGDGFFEVFLLPGTQDWLFEVSVSSERSVSGELLPSFRIDPTLLIPDADGLVQVLTPDVSTTLVSRGIVVREVDNSLVPVARATVELSSDPIADSSTNIVGLYRTSVVANDVGVFEARLLPGRYTALVNPPTEELAVLQQPLTVDATASDPDALTVFEVKSRVRVADVVSDVHGTGMANTDVRANVRGQAEGSVARSSWTTTDQLGDFELRLDPGVYDLVVRPPDSSNYPWRVMPDFRVGAAPDMPRPAFSLRLPVPVEGRALHSLDDGGSVPVQGEVRAYALLPDMAVGMRSLLVARSVIGEEGEFRLLLPSSL